MDNLKMTKVSTQRKKCLPDFLVIGAAKSGTTAIHNYLNEHPQVFMAMKETRFFAYGDAEEVTEREGKFGRDYYIIKTLSEYQSLFNEASDNVVLGEATPLYLESTIAAKRIQDTVPDVALIASLRNPIDRAYSGYLMQVRHARETRHIDKAFTPDSHFVRASYYYQQVKRYYDLFDKERIRIYLYEDFKKDNQRVLKDIYRFIGVSEDFEANVQRHHNVGSYPKSRFLNGVLSNREIRKIVEPFTPRWAMNMVKKARNKNYEKPPKITEEIHEHLLGLFEEDILKLQDLIDQDLGQWLQ